MVSPSPHLAIERPAFTVSKIWVSVDANAGLTSTMSRPARLPVAATSSIMNNPSLRERPPRTGVPVAATYSGSMASTSKLTCTGFFPEGFTFSRAISSTLLMPYLSTWYMEKAVIPKSRMYFFSPASTSLSPMKTVQVTRWSGFWGVEVGMGVDPQNTSVWVLVHKRQKRGHADGVVTAHSKRQRAVFAGLNRRLENGLTALAHHLWSQNVTVNVGWVCLLALEIELGQRVGDRVSPAQLLDVGQQTKLLKLIRSLVDSSFSLASAERSLDNSHFTRFRVIVLDFTHS
ncbi:hypothetical protein OGAPHI_007302 [Ogataea philodendri]|uniref:Uncharacterized protein n=1 Tax=Ogataea philodendri TaxID=1378263 RepID=A0A9P8NVE9_9ASCO|nr:uncharacterized protein OGAPHI_007302 [Ogataea philodendri]KAH3660097.1 hypothetical protein OGAPHI_007302 [Ogataea philodendri]